MSAPIILDVCGQMGWIKCAVTGSGMVWSVTTANQPQAIVANARTKSASRDEVSPPCARMAMTANDPAQSAIAPIGIEPKGSGTSASTEHNPYVARAPLHAGGELL